MLRHLTSNISKSALATYFTIAGIGFADAVYLTVNHYSSLSLPCLVGSCEVVLTSAYSVLFGIPVALLGALYYLSILALLFYYVDTKHEGRKIVVSRLVFLDTILGMLFSIYFFSVQAFILHAFCQFCLISGLTSTLLFVTSLFVWKKQYFPPGYLKPQAQEKSL